jgi:hypothetical protein
MAQSKTSDIRYKSTRVPMTDVTDYSMFDTVPGFWMLRHDPSFESMMHNRDLWNIVQYLFICGTISVAGMKLMRMSNRIPNRPLFVVHKKTWVNTKVPRKRARFYDLSYWKIVDKDFK